MRDFSSTDYTDFADKKPIDSNEFQRLISYHSAALAFCYCDFAKALAPREYHYVTSSETD